MLSFKNLKMPYKLAVQVSVFVLSLVAITFLSQLTITKVKVGGVLYQGMNKNYDLINDVYPPNFNILNTRLVDLQMLVATPEDLPGVQEEAKTVRSEFEDAYATYSERFKNNALLKEHMDALYTLMEKTF